MELTITISEETQGALAQRARAHGYSDLSKYVERLISTDLLAATSFDDMLTPIRQTFRESGLSSVELEQLFEETREDVYQESTAQKQCVKTTRTYELSSIA